MNLLCPIGGFNKLRLRSSFFPLVCSQLVDIFSIMNLIRKEHRCKLITVFFITMALKTLGTICTKKM